MSLIGQINGKDGKRLEPIQLVQQTIKTSTNNEDSPRIGKIFFLSYRELRRWSKLLTRYLY